MEKKITSISEKKEKNLYQELSSSFKKGRKNVLQEHSSKSSAATTTLETPFHMLLVGMTACGKTFYLLQLLESEYKRHFSRIYLLCPTFEHNTTYQNWKYINDDDFVVVPCDQDNVDSRLEKVVSACKGTNSLIILDDCASGNAVKNRTSELVKLGFSGRHYGISTIVLTQQLTSIAKPYREQVSKIVCFLPSKIHL